MSKAILGKKLGMTQVFTEEGAVVPVTVVEAVLEVYDQYRYSACRISAYSLLWK